jgi:hypothetical protein
MSSDQIRPRIREDKVLDLRDWLIDAIRAFEPELVRSCMTCASFRESDEQCVKFKARPPARVIAYGCKDYFNEAEIPF